MNNTDFKEINVYCDESFVNNIISKDELKYMIIWWLFIDRPDKWKLKWKIEQLKKKYDFNHEIKWVKVSKIFLPFYKELIWLFYKEPWLKFHCIAVDKNRIDMSMHDENNDLAFFKFYYQLFKNKFIKNKRYYFIFDFKPSKKEYFEYLAFHFRKRAKICWWEVKRIQMVDSSENIFVQYSDFFTWLVWFAKNHNENENESAKQELLNFFQDLFWIKSLKDYSSYPSENKFNIFSIWKK